MSLQFFFFATGDRTNDFVLARAGAYAAKPSPQPPKQTFEIRALLDNLEIIPRYQQWLAPTCQDNYSSFNAEDNVHCVILSSVKQVEILFTQGTRMYRIIQISTGQGGRIENNGAFLYSVRIHNIISN